MKSAPKVKLEVDETIIDKATRETTGCCMIANAMKREGFTNIKVTKQSILGTKGDVKAFYPVSADIASKIEKFDAGKKIDPFTFTLKNGYVSEIKRLNKSPNRQRRSHKSAKRGPKKGAKWTSYRFDGLAQLSKDE